MSERRDWRGCAAAGLVTVATSIAFSQLAGLKACAPAPGIDPIIAFELARVPEQVARLLANPICQAAQSSALWLDALVFIPAYTAFLIFGARAAVGRFVTYAIGAVVVAAILDQIEGVTLWRILGSFPGDASHFTLLIPAVRAKFALLAVCVMLIGGALVRQRGWALVPGVAMVAGGALSFVSVLDDNRAPVMVLGIALAFAALLGWAAFQSLRRLSGDTAKSTADIA